MVTLEITENLIQIKFDTCPDDRNQNKMKIAGYQWNHVNKTWNAPYNTETSLIAHEVCMDHISMRHEQIIENSNSTENFNDNERDVIISEPLKSKLSSENIDELINEIKQLEEENKVLGEKSKAYEEYVCDHQELKDQIQFNEHQIESITNVIKWYLKCQNTKRYIGTNYNISLKDCSPIVNFDCRLIQGIFEKIRHNVDLPDWLLLSFKVDSKLVLDYMKETGKIPNGIIVTYDEKVIIWNTGENEPSIYTNEQS